MTINTTTGAATLVRRIRGYTVDGLAWSNDGERLYLAEGHSLFTYDPDTHAIRRIDTFKRRIEALEMGPDGYLLMGQQGSKLVVIYDPLARRMVHGVDHDHHPRHYGSHPRAGSSARSMSLPTTTRRALPGTFAIRKPQVSMKPAGLSKEREDSPAVKDSIELCTRIQSPIHHENLILQT